MGGAYLEDRGVSKKALLILVSRSFKSGSRMKGVSNTCKNEQVVLKNLTFCGAWNHERLDGKQEGRSIQNG